MSERTDSDILSAKPIDVVLGGRTFGIVPQTRRRSRTFRDKFTEATAGVDAENLNNDKLIDLIYLYSPLLAENQNYIEDHATDSQMVAAFTVIVGLALRPFLKELPEQLNAVLGISVAENKNETSPPGKPPGTNLQ